MEQKELVQAAFAARRQAYVPYSGFAVGAALLCADGSVYAGCNVESASYPATICAERTAFVKAVSEGKRDFTAIAVVGAQETEDPHAACPPCGICRQVMAEFCGPDFQIILPDSAEHWTVLRFCELLPMAFGPGSLKGESQHENV